MTRELVGVEARQSRVLQILGPLDMDSYKVMDFFHENLDFYLVDVGQWLTGDGNMKILEIHFESILGQSRSAMKCFASYASMMHDGGEYKFSYAADPCDASRFD